MSEPVEFKAGVLYPLSWLEKQLSGTMTLQTFLAGYSLDCTGRNRRFQNAVSGNEILRAMGDCTAEANKTPQNARMEVAGQLLGQQSKRKRGRPAKSGNLNSDPIKLHEVIDVQAGQ